MSGGSSNSVVARCGSFASPLKDAFGSHQSFVRSERHDCGGLSPSLIHRGIVLDSVESKTDSLETGRSVMPVVQAVFCVRWPFYIRPISDLGQRFLVCLWPESSFERLSMMSKSILFALLSVAGPCLSTGQAFACERGADCNSAANCAPSCAAPQPGMQMSQANRGAAYQSISYKPGTAAPMMSAPATMSRTNRPSSSFYDSVRGDRKIRGQY